MSENESSSYRCWKKIKTYKTVLLLTFLKLILITAQIISFTNSYQTFVTLMNHSQDVFQEIFYNGSVPQSFFTKRDVYSQLNYVREQYFKHNATVGVYGYSGTRNVDEFPCAAIRGYAPRNAVCLEIVLYSKFEADLNNNILNVDLNQNQRMVSYLKPWNEAEKLRPLDESLPLLNGTAYFINFQRLKMLQIHLGLRAILINPSHSRNTIDCYDMTVTLAFDNEKHTGRIDHDLKIVHPVLTPCSETIAFNPKSIILTAFAIAVYIVFGFGSFIWLIYCLVQLLRKEEFTAKKKLALWLNDNHWIVLDFASSILLLAGSIVDLEDRIRKEGYTSYDVSSMLLGTGCVIAFFRILEVCKNFTLYKILAASLRESFRYISSFILISMMIYLGFLFCGWAVLSPYHPKFSNFWIATETLFSLINGDDMFATFEQMPEDNLDLLRFSKVYFFVFIFVFIYLVLNVFLTIIINVYETVREQKSEKPPSTVTNSMQL